MTLSSERALGRENWWWAGLHLLLTLSLPLVLVWLAGCKQAKAKREDLGPEVATESINNALNKALDNVTLVNLAKGQSVRYSHTRRIENEENVIDLGERRVEVVDRQDTSDQARFTLRIVDKERRDNGDYRSIYSEDYIWLAKVSNASIPDGVRAPIDKPASPENRMSAESLSAEASSGKSGKITFHHLREEDAIIDPPPAMKLRTDCGGLSPCQMRVHYLQFDMAIWEDDTNYQKISFDFAFSLDSPYLPFGEFFEQYNGTLVADCRSTFVPVQSRTVYVRDCFSLEDFRK